MILYYPIIFRINQCSILNKYSNNKKLQLFTLHYFLYQAYYKESNKISYARLKMFASLNRLLIHLFFLLPHGQNTIARGDGSRFSLFFIASSYIHRSNNSTESKSVVIYSATVWPSTISSRNTARQDHVAAYVCFIPGLGESFDCQTHPVYQDFKEMNFRFGCIVMGPAPNLYASSKPDSRNCVVSA